MLATVGTTAITASKQSVIDPVQDPPIGGGVEIEFAQESGRTIEPVVVAVAFLILQGRRRVSTFLRYRLPLAVLEMPSGKNSNNTVGKCPAK
jgi:hypothetical protein